MAVVGFIGLGVMGREMSVNLVKAGHEVRAFDARAEAIAEVAAQGAKAVHNIAEAPENAQVLEVLRDLQ